MSNFVGLSASPWPDRCSDPMSIAEADFQFIGERKELRIGEIALSRIDMGVPPGLPLASFRIDDGTATFAKYDFLKSLRSRGVSVAAPFGQCTVYSFSGQEFNPEADPAAPVGLDVGPAPKLSGPKGTKQLPRRRPGSHQATLRGGMPGTSGAALEYFEPGTRTVNNGSGEADVGLIEARLTIASPVTWDRGTVSDTIPHTSNLSFRRSGGDPTKWVQIKGISVRSNPDVGPPSSAPNARRSAVLPYPRGSFRRFPQAGRSAAC